MRRLGATTGGNLPGWADGRGSCDFAAIDRVDGLFSASFFPPGCVYNEVEPVIPESDAGGGRSGVPDLSREGPLLMFTRTVRTRVHHRTY